jgi:hypothetical protein
MLLRWMLGWGGMKTILGRCVSSLAREGSLANLHLSSMWVVCGEWALREVGQWGEVQNFYQSLYSVLVGGTVRVRQVSKVE